LLTRAETALISPVITTERPRVRVAIRAFAAALEIPKEVARP